jgi:hypothetical protein
MLVPPVLVEFRVSKCVDFLNQDSNSNKVVIEKDRGGINFGDLQVAIKLVKRTCYIVSI